MSWMCKALVLGAVFFLAIFIVKPIGVSTQFSVVSGMIYKAVNPDSIWVDSERESGYSSSNAYFDRDGGKLARAIAKPWNYDLIFVLAIPVGGLLGTIFYRRKDLDAEDCNVEEKGFCRKFCPAFLSGFLLLYGARMADGCTSGHMMSGIMQGSISGYLFAIVVFVVAIPVALMVRRVRTGRGESE